MCGEKQKHCPVNLYNNYLLALLAELVWHREL